MKNLILITTIFGMFSFTSLAVAEEPHIEGLSSFAKIAQLQLATLAETPQFHPSQLDATKRTEHLQAIPGYGELEIAFADKSEDTCLNELKRAGIFIDDLDLLGVKHGQVDYGFSIIAATTVVNIAGKDEYYIMSCRINDDLSGHVAGPTKIARSQSYFVRDDIDKTDYLAQYVP